MSEQNKATARRIFDEVASKGNLGVISELVASNHVYHSNPQLSGIDGQKKMVTMYRTAFPDLELTVEDQIAEGDKVVSRITIRGTHKGDLMGTPPTGKHVTITAISIMRFADNKVVEEWELVDEAGMMQQLGVAEAPG